MSITTMVTVQHITTDAIIPSVVKLIKKQTTKKIIKTREELKEHLFASNFAAPKKTLILNGEWICANTPCQIIKGNDCLTESVQTVEPIKSLNIVIKPFNKKREYDISKDVFDANFYALERAQLDESGIHFVEARGYPNDRIMLNEFLVEPFNSISAELKKHFTNDKNFLTLLEKAHQDAYTSKGNTFCINMKEYETFIGQKESGSSILTRVGDPIFNRASRHSVPVLSSFTRKDFEISASFPAPIGIKMEDFALPSEQNNIYIQLLTQAFSCVNAPQCPVHILEQLGITIEPESHKCDWCGEKIDVGELNQTYCSKEHSLNFCHRDPKLGTRPNNVYIGHCGCNREQGGYSEEERVAQIIRLSKTNDKYREMLLCSLTIKNDEDL